MVRDKSSARNPMRPRFCFLTMKTLISFSSTVGKTVAGVYRYGEGLVMSFSDDTFAMVKADSDDYENYPIVVEPVAFSYEDCCGDWNSLVEAGVCTREELEGLRAALEARRKAIHDEQERRLYHQLCAKYENRGS